MRLRSLKTVVAFGGCALLALAGLPFLMRSQTDNTSGPAPHLALLVGCTQYERSDIPELYGPANDVRLFADLLQTQFGFADGEITQLAGWPSDPTQRPTQGNITAGFERLIERAAEGTQVVILLAGHGVQVPIPETQTDPLDPRNPEPDGMDEVFLPADVRSFTRDGLENAIRDDQFGVWVDRLRAKGAAVWIVFDCCHAGDMLRGDPEQCVERDRFVDPAILGVTAAHIEQAQARAHAAVTQQVRTGGHVHGPLQMPAAGSTKGSVVAFYAAQPFEKAPELPCPENAPRTRDHYYGLLSYTLIAALRASAEGITYEELAHALVRRYDAERGQRGPTPGFDGDLSCAVLGTNSLGQPPLLLERTDGRLEVNGGMLHGLNPGSILMLHPPAYRADGTLARVRVVSAGIDRAEVVPCEAADADCLPERGRCHIISRDVGDMRLKLFVRAATAADQPAAARVQSALAAIDPAYRGLFQIVPEEASADWVLWTERDEVRLQSGTGMALHAAHAQPPVRARYPLSPDPATLAHDVQAIFTWRNLWRVAGAAPPYANRSQLTAAMYTLKRDGDREARGDPLPAGAVLRPPQDGLRVQLDLANTGAQHLWVTILALGPDMSITLLQSLALEAGKSFAQKGVIGNDPCGKEGLVVIATPQDGKRAQPNYAFLQQDGLGVKARKAVARSIGTGPRTPFEELLQTAALGKGRRGFDLLAPSNPLVYTWSWTTLPPAQH